MKKDLLEQLKELLAEAKGYLSLQVDVAKLTVVEKLTLLLAGITMGLIAVLLLGFVILLLAFAAAHAFEEIMNPAFAYLSTAGVVLLLLIVIYFARKPLIINPIAKLLSKLFMNLKF